MKSFLARLFGTKRHVHAEPAAAPAERGEEDRLADLRDKIRSDVAAGFYDEDVILTQVGDYFEGEIDAGVVRREAPPILRSVLAEHARAEASWPAVTDCDRLDAAFATLEADGVIARQNFTCCMTCGSTEIWDEIRTAAEAGLPARGYTFYHVQDTEAAVEGRGVYLAYGATQEGEAAALKVAHDIVDQLRVHGLAPEWNGSWDQRIAVPLDWKRRRGVASLFG